MADDENIRPQSTRDTRLIERALRERWPLTPDMRKRLMNRALRIALGVDNEGKPDPSAKKREMLSGLRTIGFFDQLNIVAEKEVLPQQHVHLHQGIDLDKIPTEELLRLEQEMLRLTEQASDTE